MEDLLGDPGSAAEQNTGAVDPPSRRSSSPASLTDPSKRRPCNRPMPRRRETKPVVRSGTRRRSQLGGCDRRPERRPASKPDLWIVADALARRRPGGGRKAIAREMRGFRAKRGPWSRRGDARPATKAGLRGPVPSRLLLTVGKPARLAGVRRYSWLRLGAWSVVLRARALRSRGYRVVVLDELRMKLAFSRRSTFGSEVR
jgi:hypothetical protein